MSKHTNAKLVTDLLAALRDCEAVMDAAGMRGIGDWLPPGARDLWAAAHIAAKEAIGKAEIAGAP